MTHVRGVLGALPPAGGATAERRRDAVLMVVCELLTNACRYARGPTRLDIDLRGGVLVVAVTDTATAPPVVRPWRPAQPNGHGMHVVVRLTADWGVSPAPGGKTVWAVLPVP
ncbi:ATP-binding protein [Kitasatospora sp. A2-31]|uniref:ATP-binding protein n=1 Tax=Kitasatospora sp. A2-31 TaxID=2916414 RepID=UPI001EEBE80D|nr:ATP-binding protein [Kitasatospora sp. A2-31]MCG6494310.1 ATP-binding protein [Kitasatospora sp. A2-31]